jgi:hypothetical protein
VTENVLIAIIAGVPALTAALLANRGRQHAKAARAQVQNSHNTNLREELDERHNENVGKLDELVRWQRTHQGEALARDSRLRRLEAFTLPTVVAALVVGALGIFRKARP